MRSDPLAGIDTNVPGVRIELACGQRDTRYDLLFTMSDNTRRRSSREPLALASP